MQTQTESFNRFDPFNDQFGQAFRLLSELESLSIHEEQGGVYEELANKFSFQERRYKVSLPWMEFHQPLPDNYGLRVNSAKSWDTKGIR